MSTNSGCAGLVVPAPLTEAPAHRAPLGMSGDGGQESGTADRRPGRPQAEQSREGEHDGVEQVVALPWDRGEVSGLSGSLQHPQGRPHSRFSGAGSLREESSDGTATVTGVCGIRWGQSRAHSTAVPQGVTFWEGGPWPRWGGHASTLTARLAPAVRGREGAERALCSLLC